MPDKNYVTNTLPPRLLRYVKKKGGDVAALIRRFELPDDVMDRTETRMRADQFVDLMDAAATTLGDPDLGIHLAQAVNLGDYGLIEFVVRSTPTMRDAIQQTVRYMSLVEDAVTTRLGEVRGDAVFDGSVGGLGQHAQRLDAKMPRALSPTAASCGVRTWSSLGSRPTSCW